MSRNIKILTVALIIVAALFMRAINNENLQGSLQAPGLTTTNLHSVAGVIRDCLATPSHVNLREEGLTTIAFKLEKASQISVEIKQKDKTLQTLPTQGMLTDGTNKLAWTNALIKQLVGGKTGDYTIRITAKDERENTFCEVPMSVENK